MNFRGAYFPNKKEDTAATRLYYQRLKYVVILLCFVVTLAVLCTFNPNEIMTKYFGSTILISIFLGTFLVTMISWYNYAYNHQDLVNNTYKEKEPAWVYLSKAAMLLFGVIISGLLIKYLASVLDPLSSTSSLTSSILNILIIVVILTLAYKAINIGGGNSPFINLIKNTILYIPCLFSSIIDYSMKFIIKDYNSTTTGSIILLILMMVLLYIYFKLPSLEEKINLQGGKQLINKPINTDSMITLASYEQLNGSDAFDYQYGISCWIYINSYPPSTNSNYDKFTSILNYGGKPNILYKGSTNTLMITMTQTKIVDGSNNLLELDTNGNRIIYKKKNFLLQKWNNIIINFSGGTLDIFLNGELVKSTNEVIPYMKLDNLTVGSDKGIGGGICNLVYFKKSLTSSNIYYIYNTVKSKNPPVVDHSNETIIKLT
jgi:hypothetical protein